MWRTRSHLIFFVLFELLSSVSLEKKLPDYIDVCKRYDPNISKCWGDAIEKLRPYLIKGIPEFKIPPIEPFFIDSLHLKQGNSDTIQFSADLFNLTFEGGKDFELLGVQPDYKRRTGAIQINFPRLIMKATYKARGRVLLFQFDSAGDVDGDFKNVSVNGTYKLDSYMKKGQRYIRIIESNHEIRAENMYLYLHDLFINNPEITKNVNKAINDNIDVLYNDFKPLLSETLGTVLTDYTNRAYAEYPYDILLPID
ncbi:uncharacterized protein [Onthophagus taurus]|uniref:uncharacterized protein n=1 Tax=Onthophagus taurus TaxID=166361 RepID=UPI0039BDC73F